MAAATGCNTWVGFELTVAYVSLLDMTGKPLWNEVAADKIVTGMRFFVPRDAGPWAVDEPRIEKETRSKEDVDLPWQVVVHNDRVNLLTYGTMVFRRGVC